jgi:hypothetical protein
MREKKTGRPKLAERKTLTELEIRYADLRATGLSISDASATLGQRAAEMARRERELAPLSIEIESRRKERNEPDLVKQISKHAIWLNTLEKWMEERQLSGELNVNELTNVIELSQTLISQREGVIRQLEQLEQPVEKKKEDTLEDMFNNLPEEAKKKIFAAKKEPVEEQKEIPEQEPKLKRRRKILNFKKD